MTSPRAYFIRLTIEGINFNNLGIICYHTQPEYIDSNNFYRIQMLTQRLTHFANMPSRHARAVAPWRIWTALITTLAFVMLIATSATHHHATAVDDQDCAVCSVVTHKITDPPLVVLPRLVVIVLAYSPYLLAKSSVVFAAPVLLPPSCGPPLASR